jgi:putative membrane protein
MMWWYPGGGGMSGWGWAAMSVSMLLFWAVLVLGGIALYRALNRPTGGPSAAQHPTAEQVLAERFARGEIDEEEYRRRLETLSSSGMARRQ